MSENKKQPIVDPIEKRVAMLNGRHDLSSEQVMGLNEIRAAAEECGEKLLIIFKKCKVDTGRAIAAIDELQKVRNTACDALILPFVEK
jgi:hypothetical protein